MNEKKGAALPDTRNWSAPPHSNQSAEDCNGDIGLDSCQEFFAHLLDEAHAHVEAQYQHTLDFLTKRAELGELQGDLLRLATGTTAIKAPVVNGTPLDDLSKAPVPAERRGERGDLVVAFAENCTKSASSEAGVGTFEVLELWQELNHPEWQAEMRKPPPRATMFTKLNKSSRLSSSRLVPASQGTFQSLGVLASTNRSTSRCAAIVLHPYGSKRTFWDLNSLVLVLWDLVMIPLGFFDLPASLFLTLMAWTTRLYWTCDMPVSFCSGFVTTDGSIELRPKAIAKRYLRTWFLLDCLVVGIDWLELLAAAAAEGLGFTRMTKVSRIFRILRLIRLLRLARMKETLGLLMERLDSEKLVIMIDVLKLMTFMLASGHLLACVWYAVAMADDSENWVIAHSFDTEPISMKYMMSLRWAISQFAGGMDEVTPESFIENLYAIIVFLMAYWSGAVFLGILTSSMTQLYLLGSQNSQHLTTLRRYMTQNGISKTLALRVHRNAQHALLEAQRSLPEKAVQLVMMVSEPLRVEIHYEMYAPVLSQHQFFAQYMEEAPPVMRRVCHSAMSQVSVSEGDVIFNFGETPLNPKTFIVNAGSLMYTDDSDSKTDVGPGKWITEAPLWTTWVHRGLLRAVSDARLFTLNAKEFQTVVVQFKQMGYALFEYAEGFVQMMNSASPDAINDLTSGVKPASDAMSRTSSFLRATVSASSTTSLPSGKDKPNKTQAVKFSDDHDDQAVKFSDEHDASWLVQPETNGPLRILKTSGRLFEDIDIEIVEEGVRHPVDEFSKTQEEEEEDAEVMSDVHLAPVKHVTPLPSSMLDSLGDGGN